MNEQKTPKAAPAMNNPETLARARYPHYRYRRRCER